MQVELIRFRKKISPLFTFTFAKRGTQRDPRVYTWKVVTRCPYSIVITLVIRDMSPLSGAQSSHRKSFPHVHVR